MATNSSILDLIFRSRKDGTAPKEVQKELDDLKFANKDLGDITERVSFGMLAFKGALLGIGIAALASIPALVQTGIQYDRAVTALGAYTGGAEAAAEAIEKVQDAAGNSISKLDAAQNATRLFAMGLADTADEAARLTDIAVTLGATMGKGPKEAFEDFALMLANQSILRLDSFGISGARVRVIMDELMSSTAGMTRETAFLNAVLEVAGEKMDALDAAGFQATSSIDRFNAYIEDAKIGVGKFFADGLVPILDGFYALRDAVKEQSDLAIANSDTWEQYKDRMIEVKEIAGPLSFGIGLISESQFNQAKAALEAAGATDEHALALEEARARVQAFDDAMAGAVLSMDVVKTSIQGPLGKAYQAYIDLQEKANNSTDDFSDQLADAADNLKKTTAQLIFQTAAVGLNAEATLELARNLGLVDEKTYAVASATEHMRQVYDAADGQLDGNIENTQGYLQAVSDLNAEIAAMPPSQITKVNVDNTNAMRALSDVRNSLSQVQSKTVTVTVNTQRHEYGVGGVGGYQHGGQFTVEGRPGPDRVPVSFMATQGETVSISPPHTPAPANPASGGGVFAGASIYIENTMDLEMLANRLRLGG